MIDINFLEDVKAKIASVQASLTPEFENRLDMLAKYGPFNPLGVYWDKDFHKTGSSIKPNAFMFGMIINDWDGSFQSRNPGLTTSDLRVPFQYIETIPDWKKSANYTEYNEIIGRFEPLNVYNNSGPQDFTIILHYQAETRLNSDLRSYWSMERLEWIEKKLKSFLFPTYTKGFMGPPKLLLNIGNIWRSVPIIVKDITITNGPPYDVITGLPFVRKIDIQCRVSYPLWQAQSAEKIFMTKVGNSCFAYKEINEDYTNINGSRLKGGVRNYHG